MEIISITSSVIYSAITPNKKGLKPPSFNIIRVLIKFISLLRMARK